MHKKKLLIIFIVGLAVTTGYIIWSALRTDTFSIEENNNKATLDQAIKDRNPELCSKIKGKTPYPQYGPTDAYEGLRLIEESTARKYCISNAQSGRYFGP